VKYLKLFEAFKKDMSIILVGGGISNLYCAYQIKKKLPGFKFTILERDDKLGGRVKMDKISGVEVPTGAQFIRLSKDKKVLDLLDELGIKVKPKNLKIDYTFRSKDINGLIEKLNSSIKDYDRDKLTFKEFGKGVLGDNYDDFVNMMGYTDYEEADFIDTIENYGLDDNLPGYKIANINWEEVIDKLVEKIGMSNVKLKTEVKSLKKKGDKWIINNELESDGVILGMPIKCIKKLLNDGIYDGIESQNFIKVFGKVSNLDKVDNYTILDSPLRKVIPFGNNIFTIAFSDNKDASELKDKDKDYFIKELGRKFLVDNIKIQDLKKYYWEEGTHYYKPLSDKWESRTDFIKEAQHPKDNLWVVGESVAEKQGWVNGALSSVDKISLFK
jgi:hypothetical protein